MGVTVLSVGPTATRLAGIHPEEANLAAASLAEVHLIGAGPAGVRLAAAPLGGLHLEGGLILSLLLTGALIMSRLPLAVLIREIRKLLFLIVVIILVSAAPGTGSVGFSWEGLLKGAVVSWQFVLLILSGVLLTGTTSFTDIRASLVWFFRLIPGVPATRIATMMTLTLSMIPLLFDQLQEMREARQARCMGKTRWIGRTKRYGKAGSPWRKLKMTVVPLFINTFRRADEISLAMESRCYRENRSERMLKTKAGDWYSLVLVAGCCAVAILL